MLMLVCGGAACCAGYAFYAFSKKEETTTLSAKPQTVESESTTVVQMGSLGPSVSLGVSVPQYPVASAAEEGVPDGPYVNHDVNIPTPQHAPCISKYDCCI